MISWSNPAPITAGTPLSSVQLDATAADPTSGLPASGTLVYTPPAGTIVGRGVSTLTVTFMPTDPSDYSSVGASVTLVVGPSSGLSTLALFNGANGANPARRADHGRQRQPLRHDRNWRRQRRRHRFRDRQG